MTERPHILLVNVFFAPYTYGGATVVAEQVARELVQDKRARVSVISLISRPEVPPYSVVRSQVMGIDNYLINVPQNRPYKQFYDNPEIGAVVSEMIADLSPDLMHVHCIQEIGVDILRAAKRAQVPIVISVHDYWWICERQFMVKPDQVYCAQNPVQIDACKGCVADHGAAKARFQTLQEAASLTDVITYPSHFARELCEASGLAPGLGVVWENGVHMPRSDFAAKQAARRAADPRIVFGFVGGPSAIKGWPHIREAFKDLPRSDFGVHLVDGSLDGSWWAGHDLSKLSGEWRVVPRYDHSDMDDFYAGIDVLLFLSQWKETFGLTIREALARGIKVIQTDSGGTVEHDAVDPERLISIGAGPEVLRSQVLETLEHHDPAARQSAPRITSFAEQARAFQGIMERVLGNGLEDRPAQRVNERRRP
ncbi:MAG: glycosyltransferase [Roseovarius sp.]|uniref:glycosyltransferase n=1 Tax=Roseovarius sp. TaxID=1486281 RepID=UPI001B5E505F|nr:glycosyltransferase [Roseovarius sp.]MBQ0751407.1 glycosyltransferase [Roseovarius sp.]MBQ0810701.1 glycosyltransferase [Roseovarius sp.]